MSISSEFQENVQSGDLITVRSALTDYLIIDRTFKSFDDALSYSSKTLSIIQEYDNKPFEEDRSKWNKDYLNKQKVALMINFSKERIDHIKNVVQAVLPDPEQSVNSTMTRETMPSAPKPTVRGSRTGREIISETEIHATPKTPRPTQHSAPTSSPKIQQTKQLSNESRKAGSTSESKTGRRVISEQRKISKHTYGHKNSDSFDYGVALIVGGVAVTAIGVITVKPLVIGAGVVLVGAGSVIKAKDNKSQSTKYKRVN